MKKIIILGGGTAGWMTAAALSKFLPASQYSIHLIESESIGTVGVGEATIPHIREFNDSLGIDENEFIRATGATYKLAIQFLNWGDAPYFHPFGSVGHDLDGIDFHQFWMRLKNEGVESSFDDYSISISAAKDFKFQYPSDNPSELLSEYGYAFHLDASLYAKFLKEYSLKRGVRNTEGKVLSTVLNHTSGDIESLALESGQIITGDLFVDCSGFRGVLIEGALKSGYTHWQKWLPCDRAFAVPTEKMENPPPYTQATAKQVGWQWRIPLQHRTGNGYVYCSDYISDDDAMQVLLDGLQEKTEGEVRKFYFATGKRNTSWLKNCVAIGLSGGFLEPLESTSIYLIQVAIQKLIAYFPTGAAIGVERDAFNRHIDLEYESVRDFLILHYHTCKQSDSKFWQHCRSMEIPESLQEKMALFQEAGHVASYRKGLFMPPSWLAVYFGQNHYPKECDVRVRHYSVEKIQQYFSSYKTEIEGLTKKMQSHNNAIAKTYKNIPNQYPVAALSLYGIKGR